MSVDSDDSMIILAYMATNPVLHARTKDIELDYHFVRDKVAHGHLRVLYVSTHDQLADILTICITSRLTLLRDKWMPLRPIHLRGSIPKISRLPLHLSTHTWGGKRDWRYYQYRVNHTYLAGSLILISSRIREKTEAQALVTYKEWLAEPVIAESEQEKWESKFLFIAQIGTCPARLLSDNQFPQRRKQQYWPANLHMRLTYICGWALAMGGGGSWLIHAGLKLVISSGGKLLVAELAGYLLLSFYPVYQCHFMKMDTGLGAVR